MKKQALAIALASALGTFAVTGYAQTTPPTPPDAPAYTSYGAPALSAAERSGFCLLESALSIVASKVALSTCASSKGKYYLDVSADGFDEDYAWLDSVALVNVLGPLKANGQTCTVTQDGAGSLSIPLSGAVRGTPIADYAGNYGWKIALASGVRTSPMMIGDADLKVNGVAFDEHIIKDFYKPCTGSECSYTAFDYGIEAITKNDLPREKWWQKSKYTRENGHPGELWMEKTRLEPKSPACAITLHASYSEFVAGNFEFSGYIQVK